MRRKRKRLTEDKKSLCQSHIPLARSLISTFKHQTPCLSDEFESNAFFALVLAAEAYEEERGFRFASLAKRYVFKALESTRRSSYRRRLDRKFTVPPKLTRLITDHRERPVGHNIESSEQVEGYLRLLPRKSARVMRAVHAGGLNQYEAAKSLKISQSLVNKLLKESIEILNQEINRNVRKNPLLL
jgi:RNA polymerase sigma factor (sigma-70 family)